MSSQSSPIIPSAEQLAAARTAQWHQNGEALLTFENLRSWINASGLVLFTSRTQQLASPAPSMVEAVLGTANAAPGVAETEQARSLLARLIAEGAAVPLNLMGTLGETPDFIASTAVIPYIFTLRGDKTWKQPPTTSGATKVSPLALAAYNLLAESVTLSAYDLTTQLGKEVTEAAVLRALNELWSHLRVLPIPQNDGAATLWELTSARFTKQIKAGANAGQPKALSALITLYLGQAMVATEEEIEVFLSPLAARSRIRDVVHALLAARELETLVIEGKTLLHVTGGLPQFLGTPVLSAEDSDVVAVAEDGTVAEEGGPRIKKFVAKPRKTGTGFVTKPGRFAGAAPDRERRPFERAAPRSRAATAGFDRPWEEEKTARLSAAGRPSSVEEGGAAVAPEDTSASAEPREERRPYTAKKPGFSREGKPAYGARPAFGARAASGGGSFPGRESAGKPGFNRARGGFANKPSFRSDGDSSGARPPRRDFGEGRPPRREFTPRTEGGSSFGDSRPPRKSFAKPGGFAPRREGFAGKPSFSRDDARPPRREAGSGTGRDFGGSRPARSFAGKPSFSRDRDARGPQMGRARTGSYQGGSEAGPRAGGRAEGRTAGGPPFRKFDAPRVPRSFSADRSADRPKRTPGSDVAERSSTAGAFVRKPREGFAAKKSYGKSSGSFAPRASGGFAGKAESGATGRKPFGKSFAKAGAKFAGKSGDKPRGKFAGKAGGKPAGTFDKFMGNKKPFGKRAPARKIKPEESGSAK